jgi:hypothetical protein
MAHPLHHSESSARKFGGKPEDYQPIHDWFDGSKAHYAVPSHRALRHHTLGIFEAEQIFGISITNSACKSVPVRWIGEQHCREDCRRIPTVQDWLRHLPVESWMVNGVILPDHDDQPEDPELAWREAVTKQETTLGLTEWIEKQKNLWAKSSS